MMKKTETQQFQYEIQAYQEDCVNNIISLFESLRQKEKFEDVLTAHHNKNKYKFFTAISPKEIRSSDIFFRYG